MTSNEVHSHSATEGDVDESQNHSPLGHYLQETNRSSEIALGGETDASKYHSQLEETTESLSKTATGVSESH
jgi:hypothetical protein